jgi:hypothetical protein
MMMSNNRIRRGAILNRSCVADVVKESMLLISTPQNPFSTAC